MKAYVFPGQGSQFPGMAKELYDQSNEAQELFEQANEILGFKITDIMFEGSADDLKETKVTQPAIFLHSVVLARLMGDQFNPDMAAGHSLGEFSALTAAGALSFESGLKLVAQRANAMQKATEQTKGTMAAILGLDDEVVESHCEKIDGIVVPANYNCPGQLVISGEYEAVEKACEALSEAGARRAMILPVGGAFHSPLMEPARADLASAIEATEVSTPSCPIYQNVTALPVTDGANIKSNLVAQLTAPVRWTQTMNNMILNGANAAIEVGPGKVLQGLFKKVDRRFETASGEL
ncbi:MAG: ACP S-malonyltransferase [Bacteroidota bacterium]